MMALLVAAFSAAMESKRLKLTLFPAGKMRAE
jgi:hypothetical protein